MNSRCVQVFVYARRPIAIGCALLLSVFSASSIVASARANGLPQELVTATEVGRFALEAPTSREFVLRGTLPVPKRTFPRADGAVPFAVRDSDGQLVSTQVEVVSRWPEDDDGADVVEILARVHLPANAMPGGRIEYAVFEAPHVPDRFVEHPAVQAALRPSAHIRLSARDVFGNDYVCELRAPDADSQLLRNGTACRETRVVGSLRPVVPVLGPTGTLPHLMGVHAFFRTWTGEPVISLDLHFHNGHSGHGSKTESPVGKIYFDTINLWLPPGWTVRQADADSASGDPVVTASGTRIPLVKRLDGGQLHVFPIQAQTMRRLVLTREADIPRALDYAYDSNLGFARRGTNAQGEALYSWWNPETARYFPQKHVLPRLDHLSASAITADLEQKYATAAFALRSGTATGYPILSPALGWAHPWGIDDGGMAGGDEIDLYQGLRTAEVASNSGFRFLAARHRMYTDRQPVALYDEHGVPADYKRWTVNGNSGEWLPIWCFLTPLLWAADPFGFTSAPQFQVNAVTASGRTPDYESTLAAHKPIDLEHLVRYTAPAKALAWLGNDTLAKESLALHAALFRMSYNEFPNSDYGHYIPTGLAADEQFVAAHPAQGFVFGRLEAWGVDATTAWFALADPAWRRGARPWFGRVVDVLHAGQSACSGILQATLYEQLFGGHYRARQSIEQAITEHALVGMLNTVFDGVDGPRSSKLRTVLRRSLFAMVTFPAWSDVHHAPWSKLAVGDSDTNHQPFCGAPPADGTADGGDGWQCWNSLAYGYEASQNPLYLSRAMEMLNGAPLLPGLQSQGLWNLENRAALLALAQQLQGK